MTDKPKVTLADEKAAGRALADLAVEACTLAEAFAAHRIAAEQKSNPELIRAFATVLSMIEDNNMVWPSDDKSHDLFGAAQTMVTQAALALSPTPDEPAIRTTKGSKT